MNSYEETEDTDGDNEETEETHSERSPYDIIVSKTNKDNLYQPAVSMLDILPKLPFSSIIIGKSGSGKTLSLCSMLKNDKMLKDCFDYIFFYAGCKPDEEIIKDLHLKKNCIFTDFTEDDVKKICDKLEKNIDENGFNLDTPSVCMIFDDCLNNIDFLKSKTMIKLATANRHLNVTFFLLSQYYKKIPPVVRTNASYIMFFPACSAECEKLSEEMCPPNMNKKEFLQYIKHATSSKYSFLGIHNKSENKLRRNFDVLLN
jgi:hypothetical protein